MERLIIREGKRFQMRILQTYGSSGMPSCGMTDAGALGQGENDTCYIGGRSDVTIIPNTPLCKIPIFIQHELIPTDISKSPRNMQRYVKKRLKLPSSFTSI